MTDSRVPAIVRVATVAVAMTGICLGAQVAHGGEPAAKGGTATVADRVKARRAQQEGDAKLAKGDLDGALANFLSAVTTVPSAAGFLQVARLHDKLGHLHEAVAAYEAYLELAPAREVDEARARVEALKSTPGHVVLRGSPENAHVTIGDDLAFEGFPVEIDLPPGEHHVRIAAEGYASQEVVLVVSYGRASSPAVDLEAVEHRPAPVALDLGRAEPVPLPLELATSLAPPPPSRPSWARRHRGGLVVGGLGVAALGTGFAFGAQALQARDDFSAHASTYSADRGERAAFRADLAFGAAFLLGTTAAILLFEGDDETPRASVQVAPILGGSVVGVGAGSAF